MIVGHEMLMSKSQSLGFTFALVFGLQFAVCNCISVSISTLTRLSLETNALLAIGAKMVAIAAELREPSIIEARGWQHRYQDENTS